MASFRRRSLLLALALGFSSTAAVEVSVCRDATYELSVDAASLCGGSGAEPNGWSCPKAGDVAVADCLTFLASYQSGSCVSPEDALCQMVNGDTWGCVLPSVGCNDAAAAEKGSCEMWEYSGNDSLGIGSLGSFDSNEDYSESWFTQTTKVREIYDCGVKPPPAPTAPEVTPAVTPAATETEEPTPAPTPKATENNDSEVETPTPISTPETTPATTDTNETEKPTSAPTPEATDSDDMATPATTPPPVATSAEADTYETKEPTPIPTPEATESNDTEMPTLAPKSEAAEYSESSSGGANVKKAVSSETQIENEGVSGDAVTVTFGAAAAGGFGDQSDKVGVVMVAGAAAFAAIVVAVIAIVH